jgi:hypothetical protein
MVVKSIPHVNYFEVNILACKPQYLGGKVNGSAYAYISGLHNEAMSFISLMPISLTHLE